MEDLFKEIPLYILYILALFTLSRASLRYFSATSRLPLLKAVTPNSCSTKGSCGAMARACNNQILTVGGILFPRMEESTFQACMNAILTTG